MPELTASWEPARESSPSVALEAAGGVLTVTCPIRPGEALLLRGSAGALAASPDEPADGPERRRARVGVLGLLLDPSYTIEVLARSADRRRRLGWIRGHADFSDLVAPGDRQPLSVVGPGRSGTTVLMRVLLEHPALAVVDEYPYEIRHAVALVHQLLATAAPALGANRLTPADLADRAHDHTTGPDPFSTPARAHYEWLATRQLAMRVSHTQQLIGAVYDEVDRVAGKTSSMFAEKFVPDRIQSALGHLYPRARTVVLVRDPRDVAVSQIAFNERRGFEGFGAADGSCLERIRRLATRLDRDLRRAEEDASVVLIRYEDLVRSPVDTTASALEQLGVDHSRPLVRDMVRSAQDDRGLRDRHMTAASATASIGRWRQRLDEATTEAAAEILRDVDERLGYPAPVG